MKDLVPKFVEYSKKTALSSVARYYDIYDIKNSPRNFSSSADGYAIYEELRRSDNYINIDLIEELIKAGSDVNFKYNRNRIIDEVMSINDEEKKEKILYSLIDAGVRTSRWEDELKKLKIKRNKIKTKENKSIVTGFLRDEVGLNDEEINNLETFFNEYKRDIYKESVDNNLMAKKLILEKYGASAVKEGFTTASRILTNDPKVLYARAMFFDENKIKVKPQKLLMTLGMSRKKFEEQYGEKLVPRGDMDEKRFSREVKNKLLEKYPMPKTEEELRKSLYKDREEEEK